MKAISPVISVTITFTAVLVISLAVFFASMYYSDLTRASLEYGSIKSIFSDIVVKIDDVLSGYTLTYHYPASVIAIGYRETSEAININVEFSNGTTTTIGVSGFYTLRAVLHRVIISKNTTIYGDPNTFYVKKVKDIPVILEYISGGKTVLEMSMGKVKYSVYKVSENGRTYYIVELVILKIAKPNIFGIGSLIVYSNPEPSIYYQNVSSFTISINGHVKTSNDIFSEAGLTNIDRFDLYVRVYDIVFNVY